MSNHKLLIERKRWTMCRQSCILIEDKSLLREAGIWQRISLIFSAQSCPNKGEVVYVRGFLTFKIIIQMKNLSHFIEKSLFFLD